MIIVKNTDTVRIQAKHPADPAHKRVLLSFTGIGHRMGGMDEQRPEFFTAGNAFDNVLFFSDLTRSWGNAFDLGHEIAALAPFIEGRDVFVLGNSMGAYLAILAARHIPVTACAAFVPQYSVHADIVPEETRWLEYRQDIMDWRERSLEGQFNTTTRYCILSAATREDRRHWSQFPAQPNIWHFVLRPSNHGLAVGLKNQGVLTDVLAAIWSGSFSATWLCEVTGKRIDILSSPSANPKVRA